MKPLRHPAIHALLLPALAFPNLAAAGSANANLSCRGSGSHAGLKIAADIPGDQADYTIKLTYGGKEKTWSSLNDPMVVAIDDFKHKVFAVGVGDQFTLYAEPASVKSSERHGAVYATFRAYVSAHKPGTDISKADNHLSRVAVSCTYDYHV
ncbi:MAG: hypothetical protein Q4G28_02695 [Neisseria sp.]|nr:hypothetical protein [Neisseria sp.]